MVMAECKYPVIIRNPVKGNPSAYTFLRVPCSKCINCLTRRSRQWIFRIKQELKVSESAFFVTLTYSDENLVWCESGIPTLCTLDFQKFMKRLRKYSAKKTEVKLRYFACGEYGSKTQRPHYHAIIFNSFQEDIEKAWMVNKKPIGHVHIGTVTRDSIAYNTKYIMKATSEWQEKYKEDPSFQRERAYMSLGIGKSYSDNKSIQRYHKGNLDQNYLLDDDGKRVALPEYYKNRMFSEQERDEMRKHTEHQITVADMEQFEKDLELERKGINPYKDRQDRSRYEDYLVYKRLKNKNSKL